MLNPGWLDAAYMNYAWTDYFRHQPHHPALAKGKYFFIHTHIGWFKFHLTPSCITAAQHVNEYKRKHKNSLFPIASLIRTFFRALFFPILNEFKIFLCTTLLPIKNNEWIMDMVLLSFLMKNIIHSRLSKKNFIKLARASL